MQEKTLTCTTHVKRAIIRSRWIRNNSVCDSRCTDIRGEVKIHRNKFKRVIRYLFQNPWNVDIATLYNNIHFTPHHFCTLAGAYFSAISVAWNLPLGSENERSLNSRKRFGELKSLYDTCLARFYSAGEGSPDNFTLFAQGLSCIMYRHCFLDKYSVLNPLVKKSLPSDGRREKEIESEELVSQDDNNVSSKRARGKHNLQITGMDAFTTCKL